MAFSQPPETPASRQRRQALAREWYDSANACRQLGIDAAALATLRREGRLLAVWIADDARYLYPHWQFVANRGLIPQLQPLLSILRSDHGVTGGRPTSGWEELEWLLAPNPQLDGHCPAEWLIQDPEKVVETARRQFEEDPDARW